MENNVVVLYSVRFMFKFSGKDFVNFKIVTDTVEGLKAFVKSLKSINDIDTIAYEYLNEFDCSKLGIVNKIFDRNGDNNE